MPHQQVRSEPKKSPADLDEVLDLIRQAEVDLLAVSGSDMEFDGEVGFMVHDGDVPKIEAALAGYRTRVVGEREGLHLDYVEDKAGGLLEALQRSRAHHPRGVIRDIAIGVRKVGFRFSGGELIRDKAGYPVIEGPRQVQQHHPVQVFFIEPKRRPGGRRGH